MLLLIRQEPVARSRPAKLAEECQLSISINRWCHSY